MVIAGLAAAVLEDGFEGTHVTGVLVSGSRMEEVNIAGGERADGDDREQLQAEGGVC